MKEILPILQPEPEQIEGLENYKQLNESKDKSAILGILNSAVRKIHESYPDFQGVFIYGSFVGDTNFQDIDILPVLKTRGHENPYLFGEELIKTHFTKYFPNFTQPKKVTKPGLDGRTDHLFVDNILHAGYGVVYLDHPEELKRAVSKLGTGSDNFIGTDEATQIIKIALEKNR